MKKSILLEVPYSCFVEVPLELAHSISECNLFKSTSYLNDNFYEVNDSCTFIFVNSELLQPKSTELEVTNE